MKTIANTTLKGLLFTLPLMITIGLLYWLFASAENLLKVPLQALLPEGWYITGMGVVSATAILFCVGILVQAYFVQYLFRILENIMGRIPVVKTLYSSAKDLLNFFAGDHGQTMSQVVTVCFDEDVRLIGFVTNEGIELGEKTDLVAVYLPMSYQMGGYLAYVPRSRCEPLDMPVQAAMQQVLTAHVKRPQGSDSRT